MGILDGLMGNVVGSLLGGANAQQQSPLMQAALQLLQQNGGIDGIVGRFRQAGYGAQADSWVAVGENEPISGDALQQVLGSGAMGDIANRLGMSSSAASGGLAALLPQLIDRMTPQGAVPSNQHDMLAQALSMLQQSRSA